MLPTYSRIEAKTYLDWVAPALLRHHANDVLRLGEIGEQVDQEIQQDPSGWDIHILHASELVEQDEAGSTVLIKQ